MSFILNLRRIIRQAPVWLVTVTCLLLMGCSALKLTYNQSDDLLYWWIDGYVDLQDGQKAFTREALRDVQRWHRQQQLPEYIALLQKMRAMAPNDVTPDQVCALSEDLKASFITLLRHVEPASTQLAMQLSAAQLRNVRKRYDKTNQDWRDDWLDGSENQRLQFRLKQARKRLEDVYGRLQAPQREVLYNWLRHSVFDPNLSYAERERRQTDSLQTLQRMALNGTTAAAAQAQLHAWVERSFDSPNANYRSYNQALWQENCAGFAKLHNSTTAAQRERLVESLRGYENDLRILNTQPQ